jgi:hypothetical protein
MTSAILQAAIPEPIPVRLLPAQFPSTQPQWLDACLRGFVNGFNLHAHPAEPPDARCRRLLRVLQPGAGVLGDGALELLRGIAVVAEIAVERRLRALLAQNNAPQAVTWPPLDRGYHIAIAQSRTNTKENP